MEGLTILMGEGILSGKKVGPSRGRFINVRES